MKDLQTLKNSFCKLGVVSTYQRFSANFLTESATLWEKKFHKDSDYNQVNVLASSTFLSEFIYERKLFNLYF